MVIGQKNLKEYINSSKLEIEKILFDLKENGIEKLQVMEPQDLVPH